MAFQLKSNKKESENKTIRFHTDLVKRIDKAIVGTDVTFSRFVIQACEYALEELNKDEKKSKQPQIDKENDYYNFNSHNKSKNYSNSSDYNLKK